MIGDHVWIGPQSYFDARDLVIEDYVGWGPGAKVLGSTHTGVPVDVPIIQTDLEIKPVRIEAWADIGVNAVDPAGRHRRPGRHRRRRRGRDAATSRRSPSCRRAGAVPCGGATASVRADRRSVSRHATSTASTILVTGGAGLIGSTSIDLLLAGARAATIVVLDNFVRGRRENLDARARRRRVTLVEGDIRDRAPWPA